MAHGKLIKFGSNFLTTTLVLYVLGAATAIPSVIVQWVVIDRHNRKKRQEFFALHPNYRELLGKQEVWEKAQREEKRK